MSLKQIMENESTWFHWTTAILGSFLVGTTGIVPLILIPQSVQNNSNSKEEDKRKENEDRKNLNRQLSFAVGGLLGDVFLHLLPESYQHGMKIYVSKPRLLIFCLFFLIF